MLAIFFILFRSWVIDKNVKSECVENQYFRPVGYSKVTSVVLVSHFRRMFIGIFRRINCNKEQQVINFLADSVLKFKTEIDIFIKDPKNWMFLHFSVDSPVQCCPEKSNLMQNFCSLHLMERFSEWCTTLFTIRWGSEKVAYLKSSFSRSSNCTVLYIAN